MKNSVWFIGVLVAVALATSLGSVVSWDSTGTEAVDGLSVGMSRQEVEARFGEPRGTVSVYEDPNCTTFVYSDGEKFSVGEHPNLELSELTLVREGVAYDSRFPCVGYDEAGLAVWICGELLTRGARDLSSLRFESAGEGAHSWDGEPAIPRPGYCMGGPSAFTCLGGGLEILLPGGGPSQDAARTLFLLK